MSDNSEPTADSAAQSPWGRASADERRGSDAVGGGSPQPDASQSGYGRPVQIQPAYIQPALGQPALGQPTPGQPTTGQPTPGQPASQLSGAQPDHPQPDHPHPDHPQPQRTQPTAPHGGYQAPPPSGPPLQKSPGPTPAVPASPPPHQGPTHPAPAAPRAASPFRRGFGLGLGLALGAGLVALVLGVVSSGIFMMGLIGLAASAGDASEPPPVTIWGSESAESTIVSIPVTGPILGRSESGGSLFGQGAYGYDVAAELDAVGKDDAVAVVLEMDTPGGTIYGSKAIADAVVRYQKRTGHKVVAFVRGMSASGGMYAMAPCDEVLVDHGTIVGSVGVIMGPFSRYKDVTAVDGGLLAGGVTTTGGVTQEYFTRGKGKDLGNPFRDITPEEREVLNGWMDTEYDNFVNHVAKYREIPAEKIKNEYGAYVFGPAQAIENGYADSEMGQEEAYRHIGELAGVDPDDTRVVTSSESGFLSALMGGSSSVEPGDAELAAAREQASATIRASALCVGSATVLAVHGDLARYCDD